MSGTPDEDLIRVRPPQEKAQVPRPCGWTVTLSHRQKIVDLALKTISLATNLRFTIDEKLIVVTKS
jgi:hypothetical protein